MRDLLFIEEGNPDTLRGMINFQKMRMIASVMGSIQAKQQKPYKFKVNDEIRYHLQQKVGMTLGQCFFVLEKRGLVLDDDELYEMSLKCEPVSKNPKSE